MGGANGRAGRIGRDFGVGLMWLGSASVRGRGKRIRANVGGGMVGGASVVGGAGGRGVVMGGSVGGASIARWAGCWDLYGGGWDE